MDHDKQRQSVFIERVLLRYKKSTQRVQSQINRLAILRIALFLALVMSASLSLGAHASSLAAWLCIPLLLGFLLLMKQHDRLYRKAQELEEAAKIQQENHHRLLHSFTQLPTHDYGFGKQHPFASDLDLDSPFSLLKLLDNCFHAGSRTQLKRWLEELADPHEIRRRQEAVAELAKKQRVRLRSLVSARCYSRKELSPRDAESWLSQPTPWTASTPVQVLTRIFAIATTGSFLLSFLTPLQLPWIPLLLGSLLLTQLMQQAHGPFLRQFQALGPAFSASAAIMQQVLKLKPQAELLRQRFQALGTQDSEEPSFQTLIQLKERLEYRSNGFALLLLNGFFLADQHYVWRIQKWRKQHGTQLAKRIEFVLEFEALASIANYTQLFPEHHFPSFVSSDNVYIQAKSLAHPCIPQNRRKGNDYQLIGPGRIHLITGSNMSGKSTFLRTIALNLLLARMGAPVCAEALNCNLPKIWTSIRIEDSLESGVSFFYAEVKRLKEILDEITHTKQPVLYLLDEILRGTNSRERLIACKALVNFLVNQKASGLMTTHDLELIELAQTNKSIQNYHFQEAVDGTELYFDYRLKPGELTSTNALRLLKSAGLPLDFQS